MGTAEDTLPTTGVLIGTLLVTGVAAIAGFATARTPVAALTARTVLLAAGFLAGMAAGVRIIPTALTVQAGAELEAVLGGWIIALIALSAYGLIPFFISPRPMTTGLEPRESVPLEASELTEFATTITGALFLWVALGIAILGAALLGPAVLRGEAAEPVVPTTITLVIVLLALFARVRVTVDARGLRVVSAILPIPFKRIPLHRVETVEARDQAPMEWGGWGYRIMPGRSALILRRGPGLVVGSTNGKLFAVTLDEPDTPARARAPARRRVAGVGAPARTAPDPGFDTRAGARCSTGRRAQVAQRPHRNQLTGGFRHGHRVRPAHPAEPGPQAACSLSRDSRVRRPRAPAAPR